jgi:hypothetical protein
LLAPLLKAEMENSFELLFAEKLMCCDVGPYKWKNVFLTFVTKGDFGKIDKVLN